MMRKNVVVAAREMMTTTTAAGRRREKAPPYWTWARRAPVETVCKGVGARMVIECGCGALPLEFLSDG